MSEPALPVLMRGEIVNDYELLHLIKNHNGAEVWICSSRIDGSLHVLKRFALEHSRVPAYRLLCAKLEKLDCPALNLPECTLDSSAFGFCVLYPFYEVGTLKGFLKKNGPLSTGQAVTLLKNMLSALAALHGAGIIHRDVKPGNIYLNDAGDALLGDFGIAKIPEIKEKKGHFAGSAAYMSPEQAVDSGSVGPESDIFSLGSVIYEAVTGKARYPGRDFADTLNWVMWDDSPPPVDELAQHLPSSMVQLLSEMMLGDKKERSDNAEKLLRELNELGLPEAPLILPPEK